MLRTVQRAARNVLFNLHHRTVASGSLGSANRVRSRLQHKPARGSRENLQNQQIESSQASPTICFSFGLFPCMGYYVRGAIPEPSAHRDLARRHAIVFPCPVLKNSAEPSECGTVCNEHPANHDAVSLPRSRYNRPKTVC